MRKADIGRANARIVWAIAAAILQGGCSEVLFIASVVGGAFYMSAGLIFAGVFVAPWVVCQ